MGRLRRVHGERGVFLVWFTLLFTALLGMAALAVDVGFWYADKRKAQDAADASALAGASDLPTSWADAHTTAGSFLSEAGNYSFEPGRADIVNTTFHVPNDSVFVRSRMTSSAFFSRVFGQGDPVVEAEAQATIVSVVGCSSARGCSTGPWGVPDCAYEATTGVPDCTRPLSAVFGQQVLLKSDNSTGGKFYAVQLPILEDGVCGDPSGANDYGATIVGKWQPGGLAACNIRMTGPPATYDHTSCNYPGVYSVPTCVVPVKTGNTVGKTASKLRERLGCSRTCDRAELDGLHGNLVAHIGTCVPSSSNNYFCPVLHDSPRLIILPIVRNLDNTQGYAACGSGGTCQVKLIQFVYFFIDSVTTSGSNHEVRGTFFRSLSPDEFDLTGGYNGDPSMARIELTDPLQNR